MGGKYTDAQKKATIEYLKDIEIFKVRFKNKGDRDLYKEKAKKACPDLCFNQFILDAIEEKISGHRKN